MKDIFKCFNSCISGNGIICIFHLVNSRDFATIELLNIAESFSLHWAINCIIGQKVSFSVICNQKFYYNGNSINLGIQVLLQFLGFMKIVKLKLERVSKDSKQVQTCLIQSSCILKFHFTSCLLQFYTGVIRLFAKLF